MDAEQRQLTNTGPNGATAIRCAWQFVPFRPRSLRLTQSQLSKTVARSVIVTARPPAGLTSDEAAERLAKFGRNVLPDAPEAKWTRLMQGFVSPMEILVWGAIAVELIEAASASGRGGYWGDVSILLILQVGQI